MHSDRPILAFLSAIGLNSLLVHQKKRKKIVAIPLRLIAPSPSCRKHLDIVTPLEWPWKTIL